MQSYRQGEFRENLIYHESDPGREGHPVWQTYHVNVTK